MVTEWEGDWSLKLTGPGGGGSRAAGGRTRDRLPGAPPFRRLVPGSRPAGVMTTSTLQQLVHLRGRKVGRSAVIVGAEHVELLGGRHSRARGARWPDWSRSSPAPIADEPSGSAPRSATGRRSGPGRAVSAIQGRAVESVEFTELSPGRTRTVDCDLVIFTADWIPDHELAVMAGCELDRGTLGPLVDTGAADDPQACSRPATCSIRPRPPTSARSTAATRPRRSPHTCAAPATGRRPCGWPRAPHSPGSPRTCCSHEHPPPRDRFLCARQEFVRRARIQVRQGGRGLWRAGSAVGPRALCPHPAKWAASVDPESGPVIVSVK